jgi:hypothetical protein
MRAESFERPTGGGLIASKRIGEAAGNQECAFAGIAGLSKA